MILVALGCGRLPRMCDITSKYPFVVLGTLEGEKLADFIADDREIAIQGVPVYFYETG